MMMRKHSFILLGLALAAAVLGGFFLMRPNVEADNPFILQAPSAKTTPSAAAEEDIGLPAPRRAPVGYKEYQSATYHFSLLYPESMTVRTYKEKGAAMTVVFEEPFGERAFQVFVVPYAAKEITRERFLVDIPSGVRASSTSVVLDGVPAETFYSTSRALGDTYELWFIYHGFLYEVTTYKAYDAWLGEMMRSWKFL